MVDGIYLLVQSDLEISVNIGSLAYVTVNERVYIATEIAYNKINIKRFLGAVSVHSRNFSNTKIFPD